MADRQNWLLRIDFTDASAPTDCATLYSGFSCPATGTQTQGGGFEGSSGSSEQGTGFGSSAIPTDRRFHPPDDQWARVKFASVASTFSPGPMVRCDSGTGTDDWGSTATTMGGTTEIFEHTSGAYTQLGTGAGPTPVVGDTIYCQADGSTISAGLNNAEDVSLTSALHASGDPGIYSFTSPGNAVGDDFAAGDLATLTDIEIEEDSAAGFPLMISANRYYGSYVGREIDLGSEATRFWSVAVDSYEQESVSVEEVDALRGSGESRWRTVLGREASTGFPGADFETRKNSAIKNNEHGYTRSGRQGVVGTNTRAKVSVRFMDASATWGAWIPGAWVGEKKARGIQVKIELDRRALKFQRRVTRIEVAHAS